MIRVVDRKDGKAVQKVTKPNGEFIRYQVVTESPVSVLDTFSTLKAARAALEVRVTEAA